MRYWCAALTAIAAATGLGAALTASQQPVFRASTDVVPLFVSVKSSDGKLAILDRVSEIAVLEYDVPAPVVAMLKPPHNLRVRLAVYDANAWPGIGRQLNVPATSSTR